MGFRPAGEGCSASRREALRWWGVTVSRRYSDFAWLHAQLCSHWPHTYAEHHPGALLGTPALRIAPWTLPRCHAWSNSSAGLAAIRKLPQQHRA